MTPIASRHPRTMPPREGLIARALRWARDRRSLAELDGRLLRDVGLTRADVALGVPFTVPSVGLGRCPGTTYASGVRRLGWLNARGWCLKLYAPEACAAGLRSDDLAVAGRAVRAVLAESRPAPVAGFALLVHPADDAAPAGILALTVYWWESADLHRSALLLGDPPRRAPDRAGRLGSAAELDLLARETRAWRATVLEATAPSPAAYLAECCA